MRRIKFIVALGAVMVAMLALSAGTAMADDWNDWNDHSWNDCDWDGFCDHNDFDDGFDEVLWIPEGTAAFDQVCSPGLPEGIWIPGCVFSDPIEEDHFFVVDDIDFDDDFCDCDDHHFRDDNDWDHHDWDHNDWEGPVHLID
jgi:hypothetical protein